MRTTELAPRDRGAGPGCPLCASPRTTPFAELQGRRYAECAACALVFMRPADRPDAAAERAHYLTHENDPADSRYRAWLDRLALPLAERLPTGAVGLDYGAGPGPALQAMLRERGFRVAIYDPIFAPDASLLARSYDFVTCTEAMEHFFRPAVELARIDAMLRPGGLLGVMTGVLREERDFERWRYARDPTHVCFYRPQTIAWIAARHDWSIEYADGDVVILRKAGRAGPG
jgi:hypothetical protein